MRLAAIAEDYVADHAADHWGIYRFWLHKDRLATLLIEESTKPQPFQVKLGDRVLFIPWNAFTVILDDKEFNIISEHDIVGLIDSPPGAPIVLSAADHTHSADATDDRPEESAEIPPTVLDESSDLRAPDTAG